MSRRSNAPTPVFAPWDGQAMAIRHHHHGERVARIAFCADPDDPEAETYWTLSWHEDLLPTTVHDTGPLAVAAARDAYPDYLAAEAEFYREVEEEHAYRERFLSRQAGAVARALRIPTGGQRGWMERRPKPPA